MVYSLKEAAQAVGVGKPAILKSIQKGKVSAQKNEHGQWEIDPGELHRVYPSISRSTKGTVSGKQQETTKEMSILEQEVSFLRERLRDKESQIEDLRTERDRLLQVIENQAGTVKRNRTDSENGNHAAACAC